MSGHLLLSPQGRVQGRWREAFPALRVVASVAEAGRLATATDLVWVDLSLADGIAGLRAARPELMLVALSLNPGADEGLAAFEAGVRGYCHLLSVPEMLRQVAVVVANGGLWIGTELMSRVVAAAARSPVPASRPQSPLESLTPRERDVALQVAGGASNKEVARRLEITPRTVKAHMSAIFDKLGVRDRLQLVLALRNSGGDA